MKVINSVLIIAVGMFLMACGKSNNAQLQSSGGLVLMANPLSGPNAAFLPMQILNSLIGITNAHAAVSGFTALKMCVGEVTYETLSGVKGSSKTPLKPGLLDFNPNSEVPVTIGSMDIEA